MIETPPKCSPEWTLEERNKLAAWIVRISLDRIGRDDPNMPVIAKRPTYELYRALYILLTRPASVLEANREALEKPYDPAEDYHSVFVVQS